MYEDLSNKSFITSTISMSNLFSSTKKQFDQTPTMFIRVLIIIAIASLIFFILIVFIIAVLIKLHRFRISSSEDRVSSSSFGQSTLTATSTDLPSEIYQFKPQEPIRSTKYTRRYENYLTTKPAFIRGLVPQTNLSPRFHQQYYDYDERRRVPLNIQSPTLARINPFIDHGLLTIDKYNDNHIKKRTDLPKITRLQNGDVFISA
jgi:hypothetical protein